MNETFVKSNNRIFKQILQSWINVNKAYLKAHEWGLLPWYHTERTDVSLLAAAIWKAGGVAIEEYTIKKKKNVPDPKHPWGKGDLFFSFGGKKYYCEAKSMRYTRTSHTKEFIEKECNIHLAMASEDLEKVKVEWKRLALFFQIPQFGEGELNQVDVWKKVARSYKKSAVAYYFPKKVAKTEDGKMWPGIILYVDELAK